ncbi:DUF7283 family protein [Halomicrococcus sp. NG-SE-24]|uniref:DUF7283 family protein n=1 Tax=Halomicrococcus sp. NG-SE-24 TaxID=3436928 RepID=UPI003D978896
MLDAPVDAWYVWIGVAAASAAAFGVAASFPTAPPPDAAGVASTVDSVADCEYAATAEHPLSADEIRIGAHRLGLRGDGGTAHATFAYGPVAPVAAGTGLDAVAHGASPETAFDSPAVFRTAVRDARDRRPEWRPAADRLLVRCVSWEGFDATLVAG